MYAYMKLCFNILFYPQPVINPEAAPFSPQRTHSCLDSWQQNSSFMQNILFTVCRLTAGRTPPTPRRSPPLLVLLVASTQTPPTDSVALLPSLHSHCGPLGPPSSVLISHHPSPLNSTATRGCTRISQNHTLCWNTGQLNSSPAAPLQC